MGNHYKLEIVNNEYSLEIVDNLIRKMINSYPIVTEKESEEQINL